MHPAKHIFLPHPKTGARAHALGRPVMILYIIALFTLGTSIRLSAQSGQVLSFAANIYEQEIVDLTNKVRSDNDLDELEINEKLSEAAKKKAADMFADNYWAHIAPDGTTPWVFIKQENYDYQVAGENLARDFDDSDSVVKAWMSSPTHRDNIVTPQFTEIGVAVVNGSLQGANTTLVVQMFGAPKSTALSPGSSTEIEIQPKSISGVQNSPAAVNKPVGMPFVGSFIPIRSVLSSTSHITVKSVMQVILLIFVGFIFGLFAFDLIVASRQHPFRITGSTIAHLSILLFIMTVLILSTGGIIL